MGSGFQKVINYINTAGGIITVSIFSSFGQYWILFFGFLILNIVDWLSGWYVSRLKGEENSKAGFWGICKKMVYWIVITLAFFIGYALQLLNQFFLIDLSFLDYIGWFVVAQFLVNELRSVLENLYYINPNAVPIFLINGLKIVNDKLENRIDKNK